MTLLRGCWQVLQYLATNFAASPEALGDPTKEPPQELSDRHERVLAGSLRALASFLIVTTEQPQGPSLHPTGAAESLSQLATPLPRSCSTPVAKQPAADSDPRQPPDQGSAGSATAGHQVLTQLTSLLDGSQLAKKVLASKSPAVRRAAYTFVATVCQRCGPAMCCSSNCCHTVVGGSAPMCL